METDKNIETREIDGKTYELRNLKQVTNGARERVEHLQDSLLDTVLDTNKLVSPAMMRIQLENTDKDNVTKLVKEQSLLKNGKTLADLTEAMRLDTRKEEIMAVMLMTDLTYYELTDPKGLYSTQQWLIEEAKKRIGNFEGFTTGLQLNIKSQQATNTITKRKSVKNV